MFESNQTLQLRVYCKHHLHKDKRYSWRATTATTVYPCNVHCRCMVGSLL